MITFDRQTYYDAIKESLFGSFTQEQVDGQNVLLAVAELQMNTGEFTDLRWLGYMLATTYHETAQRMWPIEEYGKGSGHDYGEPDPETGQTYYGRGFVQLTWRDNYAKATDELELEDDRDIEMHADKALDCLIATRVLFKGMREGWFTGKKLEQYFNPDKNDPVNARQIINGNDCDDTIAGYHAQFMAALNEAMEEAIAPTPKPEEEPVVTMTIASDSPVQLRVIMGSDVELIE